MMVRNILLREKKFDSFPAKERKKNRTQENNEKMKKQNKVVMSLNNQG